MSSFYVNKVRKSPAPGHEHIIGVITTSGVFYENGSVVQSLEAGNQWYTEVAGYPNAKIKKLAYCPQSNCYHKPYLTTEADSTAKNNLENLPRG